MSQDIEAALSHTRGLKDRSINVAVSGRVIVLSGKVPSLPQKEMAERAVRQFHLWEIRNDIFVTGK